MKKGFSAIIFCSLILLWLWSPAVSAEPRFDDIRLDQAEYSMERVPAMNQRGIPLCYAFSAAQMVDAWRFSHLEQFDGNEDQLDHLTSPLAAAVLTGVSTDLTYLQSLNFGGYLCETIDVIKQYGSCDQSRTEKLFQHIQGSANYFNSPQESAPFVGPFKKDLVYYSKEVEKIYAQSRDEIAKILAKKLSVEQTYFNIKNLAVIPTRDIVPTQEEVSDLVKEYKKFYSAKNESGFDVKINQIWSRKFNKMNILKYLIDKNCSNSKLQMSHLPFQCVDLRRKSLLKSDGQNLIEQIHQKLNFGRKSQPVAIKYCANFVEQGPQYQGIYSEEEAKELAVVNPELFQRIMHKKKMWKPSCLIHYSLVIGRRKKNSGSGEGYEFLVRDSYGQDCGKETLNPYWKCEEGSFWVDENVLLHNILEINFLEN